MNHQNSQKKTIITLPTQFGDLDIYYFSENGQEGLVASRNLLSKPPFLRIHSSCVFSEALKTVDCDCTKQLEASLRYIGQHGGLVIYLYQEGRGIGLKDKIEAISLEQRENLNTAESFQKLGHNDDPRDYSAAISILKELSIHEVKLGTSNPRKIRALENNGIKVVERVEIAIETNELTDMYLKSKIPALGHYEKN